jgi:hypothetical protein
MERPDPPLPKYYTVRLPNPDPSITRCHHHQIHNHLETLHSKVLISLTFKNERTYSYDAGLNGLVNSHQVGIWNSTGTLLISGTVASGTTDPLVGKFRYTNALTGILTLAAGDYVIGGSTTGDPIVGVIPSGNVTTAPNITFLQNRTNGISNTFSFPGITQSGVDVGLFGPNFQFTPATPVPEPMTILGTMTAAGMGVAMRRKQQKATTKVG